MRFLADTAESAPKTAAKSDKKQNIITKQEFGQKPHSQQKNNQPNEKATYRKGKNICISYI